METTQLAAKLQARSRPPRMPTAASIQLPRPPLPGSPAKKRPPALTPLALDEPAADGPQSFNMSTPQNASGDGSGRHYIGTPRAAAILSAFLDFDDTDADASEGPPLDFDEAMEALMAKGAAAADSCTGAAAETCQGAAAPEDECDSSGSTRCCLSDCERGACDEPGSSDDEGDFDCDREEYYESDFETDSETDDDEDEEEPVECGGQKEAAPASARIRALSRGSRAGGQPKGARDRSKSRQSMGSRRSHSRGAIRRIQSLDRVLTTLAQ